MNNCVDLFKYYKEHIDTRDLTKTLYYYKKHKGLSWYKGQNFGDYLSKIVVAELAKRLGLKSQKVTDKKLLAIGSILHFAQSGDIIWGSGVNGKISPDRHIFNNLDVRMVRGPKTKKFLEERGISVPNVFGDPALLLPWLFPKLKKDPIAGKITVIPNLNEHELVKRIHRNAKYQILSPLLHWKRILYEILTSELVLTSSLHGLILAEAFGVSVRLFKPCGGETMFKYEDYIEGTGRKLHKEPGTLEESLDNENGTSLPRVNIDYQAIIDTFPTALYE